MKIKGFTLIEIIIGLSIIAVLSAMILPRGLTLFNSSLVNAEVEKLDKLELGLRFYVEDKRKIPDAATWKTALSSVAGESVGSIAVTGKNQQTIYVYPDNFLSAATTLPYDQAAGIVAGNPLLVKPSNPRVMMISNMGKNPLVTTSGILPAATFDAIWDQVLNNPSFIPELTENKDTILIKRVDLNPSFKTLILNNNDSVNTPSFTIDGNPIIPTDILPLTSTTSYLIKSSQVKLLDQVGVIQTNHVALTDLSFDFFNYWGSVIGGNGNGGGGTGGGAGGGTTVCPSVFGGTNGALSNAAPLSGCVSGGNFQLTVNNISTVNDVNVFYGNAAGAMIFLLKVKSGRTKVFTIPGCSFVAIVPQDKGPGGFNLFYMDNFNMTVNVI